MLAEHVFYLEALTILEIVGLGCQLCTGLVPDVCVPFTPQYPGIFFALAGHQLCKGLALRERGPHDGAEVQRLPPPGEGKVSEGRQLRYLGDGE